MFLTDLLNKNENIKKLACESSTFSAYYDYWLNMLSQRAMRLFVWSNTDGIEPKEIEIALAMNGHAGITKYKNGLGVFMGNFAGNPTIYYDEYEKYSIHSPIYSKILTCKDDKDVVVISNNALRNSLYPLFNHYAMILAHIEVSFINTLINGRDAGGTPVVSNETQRQAVISYRNNLCNGKVSTILDPAFMGVEFKDTNKSTALSIKDLLECRENALNDFYSDLGVKTSWNKKGNMIVEEVNGNDSMLLLNISDMLDARKRGCERVNARFGTNWSVELSKELQYSNYTNGGVENEKTDL